MAFQKKRVHFGGLKCVQVDGGKNPNTVVFCLHGFGAPGDDLVPIAEQWIEQLGSAAEYVRFIFPAGLLSLDDMGLAGGRAWWELNMARLMQAMDARDFDEMQVHEPPGIGEARLAVSTMIHEVLDEINIGCSQVVLGGFSQGAMLAMDVALRGMPDPPAVLFQYSGTLICEPIWRKSISKLIHTEVIQSHGSFDSILPYESAERLYEILKVAGVPVTFYPFDGPHTLTYEAIEATAQAISRVVDSASQTNRSDK